jgi:uncharacterized protein YqcC (DUF446 family)
MELGRARNLQYLQCKIRKGVEISEPLSWICKVRKMLQKCPERLWEYVNVCQCNVFQSVSICFNLFRCFKMLQMLQAFKRPGCLAAWQYLRQGKGRKRQQLVLPRFRTVSTYVAEPWVQWVYLTKCHSIHWQSEKPLPHTAAKQCLGPMRHKTSDEKPQYPSKIQPVLPALQWLHQLHPHRSKEVDTRKWWSPAHDRSRSLYILIEGSGDDLGRPLHWQIDFSCRVYGCMEVHCSVRIIAIACNCLHT